MTWLRLAFANLRLSPLASAVNVILMSLGTASIVLLLLAGVLQALSLSGSRTRPVGHPLCRGTRRGLIW